MPASPYPLAGEARDVVEDVRRLGGFGIAAHPDSPKPSCAGRDWDAPIDGVELLNPDTGWRLWAQQASGDGERWYARRRLLSALLDYPFRPAGNDRQPAGGRRERGRCDWDGADASAGASSRIAGVDAHAKIAPRSADPGDSRFALPFPGYESSFRVLSIHVTPDRPLSGDAAADAARADARDPRRPSLHRGRRRRRRRRRSSSPRPTSTARVNEGDELGVGGPVTLRVRSNAPPGFTTIVWKGASVFSADHHEQDFTVAGAGGTGRLLGRDSSRPDGRRRCRGCAAIRSTSRSRGAGATAPPRPPPATDERAALRRRRPTGWRVEHDPTSLAAVERVADRRRRRAAVSLRARRRRVGRARCAALAFDTPRGRRRLRPPRRSRSAPSTRCGSRCSCARATIGRSGARALAAVGLRRHDRPGAHDLVRRPDAGRADAHRHAAARRHPQHPVRGRHDEHEAGRLRPDLDQECGARALRRRHGSQVRTVRSR